MFCFSKKLIYINFKKNKQKYVRVHYKTDVKKLTEFIYSCWNLQRPDLIISMTGGAENFSVNSNLKNVLHKGLVKTSLSTSRKIILNFNNKKKNEFM